MIRMIVAGSRGWSDRPRLEDTLDRLTASLDLAQLEVVSGTARGPDQMGEAWAEARGVKVARFPAHWEVLGKRAGHERNERMAAYCHSAVLAGGRGLCVCFWDGASRGTAHMIEAAKALGLELRVVRK